MAHPSLAAYASRLLSASFVTARDDDAAFLVDHDLEEGDNTRELGESEASEGRMMAYEGDEDPFHDGERPGWRLHQTTTALPAPSPSSPRDDPPDELRIVQDSWLPPPTRLGVRTLPPEKPSNPLIGPNDTPYVYPAPSRTALAPDAHRDAPWLVAWTFAITFVLASALWAAWQDVPATVPNGIGASAVALLSSLPLLTLFVLLSLLAGASATAYLVLVKQSIRLLITAAMIGVPSLLLLIAAWSWGGSWEGYGSATGETETERGSLRWFSLACLILAGVAAKVTYDRRTRIQRTVDVIELGAEVLLLHPALFVYCLALLSAFLILTVPALTILARLLLIAASTRATTPLFLASFLAFTWLWTLGVARGLLRLTVAGTVGHWFFCRHEPLAPSPAVLVQNAALRAIGPSMGSACCSALLLALLDTAALALRHLRRWSRPTSSLGLLSPLLFAISPFVAFAHAAVEGLSSFALVHAGITGQGFWPSARGASWLLSRTGTGRTVDYLLLKLLLNLVSLALSLVFALAGYLAALHSPLVTADDASHHASLVALVCFVVPFVTVRTCSDLLAHAVDAVFICWSMDIDAGANHCTKAAEAFGEPVGRELPR